MRKLFLVLGIIFTLLALVFTVLPMDTIAFLPIGLALIFSLLLLKKSNESQKKLPNVLLILCVLSSIFVLGKTLLIKDEIEKDTQFEQQKIETKQEAKKELEELEKDLE
jgi:predicted histidine transporter YuiF (NhaC family)